jgi:hypothetical protein
MIKRGRFFLCLLLLPALIFVSCDEFFSETWGSNRSYDSANIKLTAGNLDTWIFDSIGNPELAAAVTKKIIEKVQSGSLSSQEKLQFQEAGVDLAIESSGIGISIISRAADTLGDLGDDKIEDVKEDAITNILSEIQQDFSSGGPQAAANLAAIVSESLKDKNPSSGDIPAFDDTDLYAKNAAPGDVAQAVLVLALALFDDEETIREEIEGFAEGKGEDIAGLTLDGENGKVKVGENPSPEAVVLAAYLNLIAGDTTKRFDDNPITDAIKEAFGLSKTQ